MQEQVVDLLENLKLKKINFADVIAYIDNQYEHSPTSFKNGDVYNEATQNQGSAKVFSFARLLTLTESETLILFAEHYQSVLDNPAGNDHQNIRQFISNGWSGIVFDGEALRRKA